MALSTPSSIGSGRLASCESHRPHLISAGPPHQHRPLWALRQLSDASCCAQVRKSQARIKFVLWERRLQEMKEAGIVRIKKQTKYMKKPAKAIEVPKVAAKETPVSAEASSQ